jgi:hypothetical protein
MVAIFLKLCAAVILATIAIDVVTVMARWHRSRGGDSGRPGRRDARGSTP